VPLFNGLPSGPALAISTALQKEATAVAAKHAWLSSVRSPSANKKEENAAD
jgi:hypothetical protein